MSIKNWTENIAKSPHFSIPRQNDGNQIIDLYNQDRRYQRTREMTIENLLLENRIIFLGDVTPGSAAQATMYLLYLDNLKRENDIHMYICSPGGVSYAMLAIYDTMQFISSDVCTYCVGYAMSAGAFILAAGAKGKRYALANSTIMIHQPHCGLPPGHAIDVKIRVDENLRQKSLMNKLLAKHTGQPIEKIQAETERDRYMTSEEAKEYGLVDEVLNEEELEKK